MGGNSKGVQGSTTSPDIAASQPAHLANTKPAMQDAGMPGQLLGLSQQLGAGFGQTPAAFLTALQKIYQPAPTLDFSKTGSPMPPKAGGGVPQKMDPNSMVLVDGKLVPAWKTSMVQQTGRPGNSR